MSLPVSATLGTALITATGGDGQGHLDIDGSTGRIHLDYSTSYTGTTSPSLTTSQDSSISGDTSFELRLYISSTGANSETYKKEIVPFYALPANIFTENWIDYAVTWDASASEATFYFSGFNMGTSTGALTAIFNSTALLGIGAAFDGAGAAEDFADGLTDENKVWAVIRTEAEIVAFLERHLLGTETNLQAY